MTFDGKLKTVADYEHYCRQVTAPAWYEFLYGERGDPTWSTLTSNRAGFNALKLRPRVLTGVGEPRLATELLGQRVSLPVIVGPTGNIREDPLGEPATARAANNAGTLLVLSSVPRVPVAQVAAAAERWWQQVFVYRDRGLTEWQIRTAVELGASAIVLTVSCSGDVNFHQTVRFPTPGLEEPELEPLPCFAGYEGPGTRDPGGVAHQFDPAVSWADIDWLASLTDLPLVVKGIQTSEDARLCLEHGVAGIVVSNHGGRFAQGVRGTIEALPEVVEAVDGQIEVSLDGGVRQGQDILKALALGAKTVWIGRVARWGQTAEGQAGVERVLEILRQELRGTMALCGVADVNAVDRALVTAEAVATVEE